MSVSVVLSLIRRFKRQESSGTLALREKSFGYTRKSLVRDQSWSNSAALKKKTLGAIKFAQSHKNVFQTNYSKMHVFILNFAHKV